MNWINSLRNFLSVENPNKVLEVVAQNYSEHNIISREDSLVLYAPSDKYELVLHRPCSESLTESYSLCRCMDLQTATSKFTLFKDKVPVIVSKCKELNSSAQIQKICDLLTDHPTWNLAHLVSRLGLPDCLGEPEVARFINNEEAQDGVSPLQLAIQDQNAKMVLALLNHNASLFHVDHENNSVLHYAAATNKQIFNLIIERSKEKLNSRNASGRTPLHVACSSDKRDCVHALLEAGADVNISVTERRTSICTPGCVGSIQDFPRKLHGDDIKYGGTPLHWACSREVIEALVNKNCDINSLNFEQRTALHVMVLRNRLDCLVTLLSFKADCNIGDKDGNTPLHLAIINNQEACLKALIVFGADLSYVNGENHLPRHCIASQTEIGNRILYILHSVGAPRCPPDQDGCNDGCKYDGTFIGMAPPQPTPSHAREFLDSLLTVHNISENGKKGRLLCLDGGGIRGLVLVTMLIELEKYFHRPLCECFDWIAGTSTGGILALALSTKIPLQDCLCLYFKLKDVAFCGKRPYTTESFEYILKEAFTETKTMDQIKHPKIMITATVVDRLPVDLHIFRNYPSPLNLLGSNEEGPFEKIPEPSETFLWQAARASASAPTYFRAYGRFLDGGLVANNPTLDALTEIEEYNAALRCIGREHEIMKVSLVVSLGTGVIPTKPLKSEVDVFRPKRLWDASKFVLGISTLGVILIDQATQAAGRVVDRARSWCSSLGIPFYRFSPLLSKEVEMDETNNEVLTNMLWETKAYLYSKKPEITSLAALINSAD